MINHKQNSRLRNSQHNLSWISFPFLPPSPISDENLTFKMISGSTRNQISENCWLWLLSLVFYFILLFHISVSLCVCMILGIFVQYCNVTPCNKHLVADYKNFKRETFEICLGVPVPHWSRLQNPSKITSELTSKTFVTGGTSAGKSAVCIRSSSSSERLSPLTLHKNRVYRHGGGGQGVGWRLILPHWQCRTRSTGSLSLGTAHGTELC